MSHRRFMGLFACLLILSIAGISQAEPPAIGGCPIFPTNNAWNTDISDAPVHPKSATYISNINSHGGTAVHPDFGSDPTYGIPWTTVDDTQALVPITFDYADESEPGPYPIPSDAPVEAGGDRHVLVVETTNCILYELYAAEYQGGPDDAWTAGSGAVFDLNSNALRPDGWTSADAAGLPILPGLARCEEANSGVIDHALRFTVSNTQKAYVYPATHFASSITNSAYPPMGLRFRLKDNYDLSDFTGQSLAIATALKKYGMILADNGSNWFISGENNPACWDDEDLNQLKGIPGNAFEVVVSPPPPSDNPAELLGNGGFEGSDVNKLPLTWKAKNISGDKRICDEVSAIDGVITHVSFEGYCAFRFKGGSGENSKLQQTITASALSGNTLTMSAQANGKNVPVEAGSMVLKVIHTDTTKEKFTLPFDADTYDYTLFTASNPLTADAAKFKFQVKYGGTSGKLNLDSVSLINEASSTVLPLPG